MTTEHTATPLAAGAMLGDYRIRRSLAADAQGFRYLAEHPAHRQVLLHEFFAHEFAHREAQGMLAVDAGDRVALRWWVRSYLDRAHAVAAVRHRRLLPLIDSAEHLGSAWSSYSLPAAPLLQEQLDRQQTMVAASVAKLLVDLMDAAAALHAAGIVHRAIGPQLIWVHDDGHATLGGFGSLRAAIRFRQRALHSVAPPPYAAPEESQADAQITPAADLYAIAAVVHHAATGQRPPTAEQRLAGATLATLAGAIDNGLPATMAAGLERALALDIAQRPQSIAQWRAMMNLQATAAVAPAQTAAAPIPRRTARTWAMLGVPLLLIAIVAGLMLPEDKAPVALPTTTGIDPHARAPTDADRPRFVSLGSEAPALSQAAVNAISAAVDAPVAAAVTPVPQAAAPAPSAAPKNAGERPAAQPAVVALPDDRAPPTATPEAAAPSAEIAVLTPPTTTDTPPAVAADSEERPRDTPDHAQQLALERSRCSRHVSELFAGREFTYADIARFDDVIKLDNGRLETPKLRTDDGRQFSFLIDNQGCIVRMLR